MHTFSRNCGDWQTAQFRLEALRERVTVMRHKSREQVTEHLIHPGQQLFHLKLTFVQKSVTQSKCYQLIRSSEQFQKNYLNNSAIRVIEGAVLETTAFLGQKLL
ncbi:hypothetical protein RIF29_39619 [Crotalaria pallida]|uniref:Uncharacterized protein n=1 Tax=Crotalaria pallida TaxID=3830 RepID=A0AAN9E4L0_CROPI